MNQVALQREASVIGSSLSVIAPALKRYGIDAKEVYERHGVELALVPDPAYRVPISRATKLWADAVQATSDDAFGLHAGVGVHPTIYHSLSMALWSSSSIRQLLECWICHLSLISTAAAATLSEKGNYYEFVGHTVASSLNDSVGSDISLDATLSALVTICRTHGYASFSPTSVKLTRPIPAQREAFERFFSCPIEYSSDQIILQFDKEAMEAPIAQGNPLLMQEMEKLSMEYIMQMENQGQIGRLRKVLFEQLPDGGVDQERVSSALHMSSRTLHRKLRSEGTSYREQLDEVRCELSLQYMKHEKLSVMDIAFQLGFSNCSNFARAFKGWVGISPNEYRAGLMPTMTVSQSLT